MIVVFSRAGREALTSRTLALLDGPGGGSAVAGERLIWWAGAELPIAPPRGWIAICSGRPPCGSVADFWALLAFATGAAELHVFEDDIRPCRNLLPYLARRPVDRFTSWFNPYGRPLGPWPSSAGFQCTQAVSIPGRLVQRLALADPATTGRRDLDLAVADFLRAWCEPIVYGPSLVQHENGPRSDGRPRFPWLHDRAFVGEAFDALSLP